MALTWQLCPAGQGPAGDARLRCHPGAAGAAGKRRRPRSRASGGRAAQPVGRPAVCAHDAPLQRHRPAHCPAQVRFTGAATAAMPFAVAKSWI